MAIRAVFGIGFATGYVLGARAGRERYETLIRTVRSVKEQPVVQGAAGIVAAQAGTLASKARSVVNKTPHETIPFTTAASSNGSGARTSL